MNHSNQNSGKVARIRRYVKIVYCPAMLTCLSLLCSYPLPTSVTWAIAEVVKHYLVLFLVIAVSGVIFGIYWKDSWLTSIAVSLLIILLYVILRWEYWWGYVKM